MYEELYAGLYNKVLSSREVLDVAALAVVPGVRCSEIDALVHEECLRRKCDPS